MYLLLLIIAFVILLVAYYLYSRLYLTPVTNIIKTYVPEVLGGKLPIEAALFRHVAIHAIPTITRRPYTQNNQIDNF